MRTTGIAAVACAALMLAGCVGPATTDSAYEGKARRAAKDSLSALNTAKMAVDASLRGKMLQSYLEVLLSNAEDDISSIQTSFDSIQPPNSETSDHLRDRLNGLLSDSFDGVSQLRILARRHDDAGLMRQAHDLADVSRGVDAFVQAHSP